MKLKILIVEDQFIEANNLRLILDRAGYAVVPIAASFVEAMEMLDRHKPDLVLLQRFLPQGKYLLFICRRIPTEEFFSLLKRPNHTVF